MAVAASNIDAKAAVSEEKVVKAELASSIPEAVVIPADGGQDDGANSVGGEGEG